MARLKPRRFVLKDKNMEPNGNAGARGAKRPDAREPVSKSKAAGLDTKPQRGPRSAPTRRRAQDCRAHAAARKRAAKWALQDLNLRPADYEASAERAPALVSTRGRQFFESCARER